jgi:GNAT superfamily N-acetyltransferase
MHSGSTVLRRREEPSACGKCPAFSTHIWVLPLARLRTVADMSRVEVRPFDPADIPAAGALLAERHRRHRRAVPLLSARYEDIEPATAEVNAAFVNGSGSVAVRDGRVVGYLIGAAKADDWGPNIWVEAAGQAVDGAEAMRDMYALAAARWVEEGRTAHYVLAPASDVDLLRAWYRLAFGQQHAHGIREVATSTTPSKVTVRRAVRADIPVLAELEVELPRHQGGTPTFAGRTPPTVEECIAEWETDIDSGEYTTFVAEVDGTVVGSAIGCPLEKSSAHTGLSRPDNAGFLGFAAVRPAARGAGAGRALGEAVLAWAGEAGFDSVVTDWRVTNLLSSRAWPALGFAESFLRLHRLIKY